MPCGRTRGFDPASVRAVTAFRMDRASLVPVVALPGPQPPDSLAVPNPTLPSFNAAAAANLTLESQYLVDNSGSLDHFYQALGELEGGKRQRPVRIVHYGDSPTTADLITGDARELLQEKFGDAGTGFVLIAKAVGVVRAPWRRGQRHGLDDRYRGGGRWARPRMGWAARSLRARLAHRAPSSSMRARRPQSKSSIWSSPAGAKSRCSPMAARPDRSIPLAIRSSAARPGVAIPAGTKEVALQVEGAPVQLFGVAFSTGERGRHIRQHRPERRVYDRNVACVQPGEFFPGAAASRPRPGHHQLRHQREQLPGPTSTSSTSRSCGGLSRGYGPRCRRRRSSS